MRDGRRSSDGTFFSSPFVLWSLHRANEVVQGMAEGEVDEVWRVAEEVAAEVDRSRAEKRAWKERERELINALAAFSHPARGHRRGESSVSVGNGEGLRFVLTTEPE